MVGNGNEVSECSKSHAYRAILMEDFWRMAQMNRQFPRDYPKQFVVYLIFENRKSRLTVVDTPNIRK